MGCEVSTTTTDPAPEDPPSREEFRVNRVASFPDCESLERKIRIKVDFHQVVVRQRNKDSMT